MVLPAWLRHETQSFIHILWVYLPIPPLFLLFSLIPLFHCSSSVLPRVRSFVSLLLLSADDHLLLLGSSLQWHVFEEENRAVVRLLAGDNVEISRSLDPCSFNQFIPVNNFLHCRSEILAFQVFYELSLYPISVDLLIINGYLHYQK